MNANLTHIVIVLDRSGSMGIIREETRRGLEEFLAGQRNQPGDATLTLVQFDHEYEVLARNLPIRSPLEIKYEPRGWTALLDAIGRTITFVGEDLAKLPEYQRPGKVIFVVITDGHENHSTEYTSKSRIFSMITHQREVYKWEFIFLGANQDAIDEGRQYGIPVTHSVTYAATASGIGSAYGTASASVSNVRAGKSAAIDDSWRKKNEEELKKGTTP